MRTIPSLTEQELAAVKLPTHGGKYAVIPHMDIVKEVRAAAATNNLTIKEVQYRATANGEIATGLYFLQDGNDPDIKMMFAWTNSYNKMRRFSCGVGTYVNVCLNGMLSANYGTFSRKHTGTAHEEMIEQINQQFSIADQTFYSMVAEKNKMIERKLTNTQINEIVGKLFMDNLLGPVQMSIVKSQIEKPDYQYSGDSNSVWHLYNHATHALKQEHPFSFAETHQKVHQMFLSIATDTAVTEPGLTAEAEVETEEMISEPVDLIETVEEIVTEVQQETDENPFWLSL